MCKFKPPLNDHAEKYSETSVVVDSLLIVTPIVDPVIVLCFVVRCFYPF